jgi:hypothetical protein
VLRISSFWPKNGFFGQAPAIRRVTSTGDGNEIKTTFNPDFAVGFVTRRPKPKRNAYEKDVEEKGFYPVFYRTGNCLAYSKRVRAGSINYWIRNLQ